MPTKRAMIPMTKIATHMVIRTPLSNRRSKVVSSCAQKKSHSTEAVPQTRHTHPEKIGNSCTQIKVQKPDWSRSRLKNTLTKLSEITLQPLPKGNNELLLARQGWDNLEERMNIGCSSSCPPPFTSKHRCTSPVATKQMRSSDLNDMKGVFHKKSGFGCSWSVLKQNIAKASMGKPIATEQMRSSDSNGTKGVIHKKSGIGCSWNRNLAYHFGSHEAMHPPSASQPSKETNFAREGSACLDNTSMSNDGNKQQNTDKSSHSLSEIGASKISRYVESNCARIVDTKSLLDLYMWHREYQANVFQGLKEKN